MCLLIGPAGVGKTLFLKRLQNCNNPSGKCSFDHIGEAPSTIPTVGTNLVNVIVNRRNEITVRELGGSMGPIWHKYYENAHAIIFMVDISNRLQVSSSCIQLYSVLKQNQKSDVPVLLIFNKIDMPETMSQSEIESVYKTEDIIRTSNIDLTVLTISAKTGQGLDNVVQWIADHSQSKNQ